MMCNLYYLANLKFLDLTDLKLSILKGFSSDNVDLLILFVALSINF